MLALSAVFAGAMSLTVFGASEGAGEVAASRLNFRSQPDLAAEIIDTVDRGNDVLVLGQTNDQWYKVYYNNTVGYMYADYLTVNASEIANFGAARCGENGTELYIAPDTESEQLAALEPEAQVEIFGVAAGWYYVTADDVMGYVQTDSIDFDYSETHFDDSAANSIVSQAMSYLGVPYVYGGTSPSGFDCSGLVNYVYTQNGYSVNRTAQSLMDNGVPVEDLVSGDLVFFANGADGGVGHVGIYIGDGQFVHASSGSGQVRVSTLSENYYTTYYCAARRIVE